MSQLISSHKQFHSSLMIPRYIGTVINDQSSIYSYINLSVSYSNSTHSYQKKSLVTQTRSLGQFQTELGVTDEQHLQGFSTWQKIMSCVTVAQVTMQTRDWARDCTILLHTKTHATVLEDSVYILTYQSTLNYPTDKRLFYFSTISAIAKITIVATISLSSNMVSFSLLFM